MAMVVSVGSRGGKGNVVGNNMGRQCDRTFRYTRNNARCIGVDSFVDSFRLLEVRNLFAYAANSLGYIGLGNPLRPEQPLP